MASEVVQVVSTPSWVEIAMFFATSLYLVATTGIFLSNRKMAKAAEDQIKTAMTISDLSRKVELFDKRQKFYDAIEDYIERVIPVWENDVSKGKFFYDYSDLHILALFDQEILDFWNSLKKADSIIITLHGDYKYAEERGSCKGRNCQTILGEIDSFYSDIVGQFQAIKKTIFEKYLKL